MIQESPNAEPARRLLGGAGQVLLVTIGAMLGAIVLLSLIGLRPMVVMSGSMSPALIPGDMVVSRAIHPRDVHVGDVIIFADPTRENALVTHRVVAKELAEDGWSFVTRGDANTGEERWSIAGNQMLGMPALRIPRLGRVAAYLAEPSLTWMLVAASALTMASSVLKKIRMG
jgi:signal peptidase I